MKRFAIIMGICLASLGIVTCIGCDTREVSVTKSSVPNQPATQGDANNATGNKKAGPPMPGP